jgi:uncharacterized membrane protein
MKSKNAYWILSFIVVILTFGMIGVHWNDLPEQVAMHFNAQGVADRYGDKSELLILPVISVLMVLLLRWITNKMLKINPHKMGARTEAELALSKTMMAQMALFISVLLAYATYLSMAVSVGKREGLGNYFLVFVIIGMLAIIVNYLWKLFKQQ